MCGRAAQTVYASQVAASCLGVKNVSGNQGKAVTSEPSVEHQDNFVHDGRSHSERDNYNMSPGMDAAVMWMEDGELRMDRKVYVECSSVLLISESLRQFSTAG